MDRLAMLDVTETGTSPCWFDTDAYKLTCLLSCINGQGQCLLKSSSTRYDMISRKDNHRSPVIARCHPTRPEGDCRCGIAFGWFRHNVFLREIGQQVTNGR